MINWKKNYHVPLAPAPPEAPPPHELPESDEWSEVILFDEVSSEEEDEYGVVTEPVPEETCGCAL